MEPCKKRLHTCCFTGHRPEKLHAGEADVKMLLGKAIRQAVSEGYTTFISGMARGVDLWAAECVLEMRRENPSVCLICALPFAGFGDHWGQVWRTLYQEMLSQADGVEIICHQAVKSSFQKRNRWMIDQASLVLAVYNGSPGGTRNSVNYAEKQGVSVRILSDMPG